MKNNIGTIMKKELSRFFGDKRLFFTTVLMPGIMIYVMYTFLGTFMNDKYSTADDYEFKIVSRNLPESVEAMFEGIPMILNDATESDEFYQEQIRDKELDLYMVFPENFEEEVASYEVSDGQPAPNIELYYISTESNSSTAYHTIESLLNSYESLMINKFDINAGETAFDLASDEDIASMVVSMMMPMLMMTFLFSGCAAVAPESIAGEKERGTIATLLVTPMKRSELAIGKIVSLTIMALLSGCSSFFGTMLSLPKMMSMAGEINTAVYKVTDYVWLLAILLCTVLVMIALVSILSANAKSVKEASTVIGPLTVLMMLIGVSSLFGSGAATNPVLYLIPLYNSVQCMTAIFSFDMNVINIVITVASNLVYALIMVFGLTKMFESEKVMFS